MENSVLTDLRPREIASLSCIVQKMGGEDIQMRTLPDSLYQSEIDEYGHEILIPDTSTIEAYIQSFNQGELIP
jgi:hypothetical protein